LKKNKGKALIPLRPGGRKKERIEKTFPENKLQRGKKKKKRRPQNGELSREKEKTHRFPSPDKRKKRAKGDLYTQ